MLLSVLELFLLVNFNNLGNFVSLYLNFVD